MASRKDAYDKEKNAVLAKDYCSKNPVFSTDDLSSLYDLFMLYADPRSKRAEIRDILSTAKILGLDTKNAFVFRLIDEVSEGRKGEDFDFEGFIKELTHRLGNATTEEGRMNTFSLLDYEGRHELTPDNLRYINEQFKYGYNDKQLDELITKVGGFEAQTITADRFSKYIERRVNRRRQLFDM